MNVLRTNRTFMAAYPYANTRSKVNTSKANFMEQLKETGNSKIDIYKEYLKKKYGNIIIQDAGKDQKSMDIIGANTAGHNNVVIAPNILEEMANNPQKAAYYENQIQTGLNNFSNVQAQLLAAGFEIHSYGVAISSDSTVYTYVSGDLKPEVRAKIEAKIKAEDAAKAKRRQQYQKQSEYAIEKRIMEKCNYKSMTEFVVNDIESKGRTTFVNLLKSFKMDTIF